MPIFNNIPITTWDLYDPERIEKNYGHTISIPNRVMNSILEYQPETENPEPIYIEIKPMTEIPAAESYCIVFGNTEITENEVVVVPGWAFQKLGIDVFTEVSLENVTNIRKVGYMKVQANLSDYAWWDSLKETLEQEIEKINTISVGDIICINDVTFTVKNLEDTDRIPMLDGSLFRTDVKIDFDMPLDMIEKERKEEEMKRKIEEERIRIAEECKRQVEELERQKEQALFPGAGNTIAKEEAAKEEKPKEISREERARMFEERFKKMSEEKK